MTWTVNVIWNPGRRLNFGPKRPKMSGSGLNPVGVEWWQWWIFLIELLIYILWLNNAWKRLRQWRGRELWRSSGPISLSLPNCFAWPCWQQGALKKSRLGERTKHVKGMLDGLTVLYPPLSLSLSLARSIGRRAVPPRNGNYYTL